MARRIPDQLIDEIRAANDIVDVISERIQVKKAGRNYKAICPFHQEKTPSFNINPERQIYHCFGCGVGGNVITFLMEYEKLGFIEAVRELAERAGIAIPERTGAGRDEAEDPVYRLNALATRYFRECFDGPDGDPARSYWRTRGISDEITATFNIGYAKPGWDGFLREAARHQIGGPALEEAGLAIRRDDGGFYDRFRNRLMFPLAWSGGRVVGFGGRALDDSEPKYLNSPETRVYHKGRYLYGLTQARSALRASREAILVEGYMDLLSLHQAGFHNVVASAGTALTQEQAKIISRYAERAFIAYDSDAAGLSAATRAAELLVQLGVKVRVASLPDGQDPDSVVREHGSSAFKDILERALDFIDFLIALVDPKTPEDREQAARDLIETVARVEDPIKADLMLEKIADSLSIDRGAVTRAHDSRRAAIAGRRPSDGGRRQADGGSAGSPDPVEAAASRAVFEAQKGLLALLVAGGTAAERIRAELSPADFADPAARSLFERVSGETSPGEVDVGALLNGITDPAEAGLLTELSVLPEARENGGRLCDDYIGILRRSGIEAEIRAVESEIETAEMTGDEEKLLSRVAARQELARRLRELSREE